MFDVIFNMDGVDIFKVDVICIYEKISLNNELFLKRWLNIDNSKRVVFIGNKPDSLYGDKVICFDFHLNKYNLKGIVNLISIKFIGSKLGVATNNILDDLYVEFNSELLSKSASNDMYFSEVGINGAVSSFENLIFNISTVDYVRDVEFLKDSMLGKEVLIVGSGPSLDSCLSYIKKYKDKIFIMAAGSSILALSNYDIKPDLVFSVDPTDSQGNFFEKQKYKYTTLVFSNRVNNRVLKAMEGETILFSSSVGLNKFIEESFDINIYNIDLGTSVLTFATNIAIFLGFKKIAFVGLDLSSNDKYYSGKIDDIGIQEKEDVLWDKPIIVDDIFGNKVKSRWKWVYESRYLASLLESKNDITFYNCTNAGIGIRGCKNIHIEQFLNTEILSHYDEKYFENLIKKSKKIFFYKEKIKEIIYKLYEDISISIEKIEQLYYSSEYESIKYFMDNLIINQDKKLIEKLCKYNLYDNLSAIVNKMGVIQSKINKSIKDPEKIFSDTLSYKYILKNPIDILEIFFENRKKTLSLSNDDELVEKQQNTQLYKQLLLILKIYLNVIKKFL